MNQAACLKSFNYYHLPYKRVHLVEDADSWLYRKSRLSDKKILNAMFSDRSTVSYFASSYSRQVTIDIDDHISLKAWNNNTPSIYLLKKYYAVVDKMNLYPSTLIRTPRGLHATWYMHEISPTATLERVTSSIMKGLGVEVKPTCKTGIRIPNALNGLNVKNISPQIIDFSAISVYSRIEIFDVRYDESNKETKYAKRAATRSIKAAERRILKTLSNGSTNSELSSMMGTYRAYGLTIDEAIDRFTGLLHSVGYKGDLLIEKNIRRRAENLYNNNSFKLVRKVEQKVDYSELVNKVVELLKDKVGSRAVAGLKKVVEGILYYKDKQEFIFSNHETLAEYNEQYKFFRYNMKNGFTPIPYNYLVTLNARYQKYMGHLMDIGFIKQSDMNYSAGNYCKSYYVETDISYLHEYFDAVHVVNMVDYYTNFIKPRSAK